MDIQNLMNTLIWNKDLSAYFIPLRVTLISAMHSSFYYNVSRPCPFFLPCTRPCRTSRRRRWAPACRRSPPRARSSSGSESGGTWRAKGQGEDREEEALEGARSSSELHTCKEKAPGRISP